MNRSWLVAALVLTVLAVREAPSSLVGGLPTTPSEGPGAIGPVAGPAQLGAPGPDVADPSRAAAAGRAVLLGDLVRARRAGSLDEVLRVTEDLAALGDREGVARGLRIAETLAGSDADARADVRDVTRRVAHVWAEPTK